MKSLRPTFLPTSIKFRQKEHSKHVVYVKIPFLCNRLVEEQRRSINIREKKDVNSCYTHWIIRYKLKVSDYCSRNIQMEEPHSAHFIYFFFQKNSEYNVLAKETAPCHKEQETFEATLPREILLSSFFFIFILKLDFS